MDGLEAGGKGPLDVADGVVEEQHAPGCDADGIDDGVEGGGLRLPQTEVGRGEDPVEHLEVGRESRLVRSHVAGVGVGEGEQRSVESRSVQHRDDPVHQPQVDVAPTSEQHVIVHIEFEGRAHAGEVAGGVELAPLVGLVSGVGDEAGLDVPAGRPAAAPRL